MTDAFLGVNGNQAVRCVVTVPNRGPWYAEIDLAEAPTLTGRVTIAIGELRLVGTVDARADGTSVQTRKTRVIAGAGGWGTLLAPKHYHNDASVKRRVVAQDAAREAGETLGTFAPTTGLGVDYVRPSSVASGALDDAAGDLPWWVDYDGLTQVQERTTSTPAGGSYVVEAFDPRSRVVTLAVDDVRSIVIGSVLEDGLDEPQTVRELVIECSPESTRIRAWCGGDASSHGRLASMLRAIVTKVVREEAPGPVKYRVSRMNADRVELQLVNRRTGLPDLLPLSVWPGIAGAHATLTPGAEVLVEFIDGDRAQPIITHFAGKDGVGFVPVKLALCDAAGTAPFAARVGDSVQVTFAPGSLLVSAQTPVYNPAPVVVDGVITGGSSKVAIG